MTSTQTALSPSTTASAGPAAESLNFGDVRVDQGHPFPADPIPGYVLRKLNAQPIVGIPGPERLRDAIREYHDSVRACEAIEEAGSAEFHAAAKREADADFDLLQLIRAAVPRPVSVIRDWAGEAVPFAAVRLGGLLYVARPGVDEVLVVDERSCVDLG